MTNADESVKSHEYLDLSLRLMTSEESEDNEEVR